MNAFKSNLSAFFDYGFRAFFTAATLMALLYIPCWALLFTGGRGLSTYYGFIGWHSHEMIYGFAGAVIAGFLLTASSNWIERPIVRPFPLALLLILWLGGRIAPFIPHTLPRIGIAAIDLLFLPLVACVLFAAFQRYRLPRNQVFPLLLLVLAAPNVLIHLQAAGKLPALAGVPQLSVDALVLLVAVTAGRLFPFFTKAAIPHGKPRRRPAIEWGAAGSIVLLALAGFFHAPAWLQAILAAAGLLFHLLRLSGWFVRPVLSRPILWVLYAGYLWLPVAFALKLAALAATIPASLYTHALTTGLVGVTTLGMMSRVSFGHTGRPMRAGPLMTTGFLLINAAALVRVGLPILDPEHLRTALLLSGLLWVLAFAACATRYLPLLFQRPLPPPIKLQPLARK